MRWYFIVSQQGVGMECWSFFTGIGGLDLGFERAGIKCVLQVENGRSANRILRRHYPDVHRAGDIKEFEPSGTTDVIFGGFPCQDVSIAGDRAGLAGERSGLWFEFHRIVKRTRPQWVVVENVPGLLSSNRGRDLAIVLRGLVECGYGVCYRVLDAQYFGVPQRRRRVFIVGHLGDGRAAEILFEREGRSGRSTAGREARQGVAAITTESAARGVARTLTTKNQRIDFETETFVVGTLAAAHGRNRGLGNEAETDLLVTTPFPSRSVTNSDHRGELLTFAYQQSAGSGRTQIVRAGQYAGTISANRNEGILHNGVRRLTPLECERLQGFPDGWTAFDDKGKPLSDGARGFLLGNAVCVPNAEWIARRIMDTK